MPSRGRRAGGERRAEPRRRTSGFVTLRSGAFGAAGEQCLMLDVSGNGFRAQHSLQPLAPVRKLSSPTGECPAAHA